ncbi:diadenylate cyclase CdaA [bacterium]|nr:diadenylate cyclase CdaA [bacterium]
MSQVFEALYDIRWQDILDIVILSIVIYRILLMLRGTRTIQILIGFLLVGVAFYFVDLLALRGITWVLRNIFNSIVIVFIVLFQSEIKNALAQMGTKTVFPGLKHRQSLPLLDKIFSVCEHFSNSRIGALIVLEKEMGLGDYYKGATEINAEFSQQLLVSLFHTNSPLHDGAAIINGKGKIAYAGCILPISKQTDFSKKLGTRHRAALGLSEETDAAILVVSEESGRISLAWNGELTTETKETSLKEKLKEILIKK